MNRKCLSNFIISRYRLFLSLFSITAVGLFAGYFLNLVPFEVEYIAEANRGGATEILDSQGGLLAWRVDDHDSWRIPVGLSQVSPWVVKSIIAAEDQRFWEHCGVDFYALARALLQNIRYGRRVSGASTISMQAMRLLYPAKRNWTTKISETLRALLTENNCDKEAILEVYLNLAPYGGNVVGIEAAARYYFGKSARELSLGEAALLSGIPQSPARFNPRKHLAASLKRREYVLERMQQIGMVSSREVADALKEKIIIRDITANKRAHRFADYVMQLNKSRGGIVRTTIDSTVQAVTETLAKRKYKELSKRGISGLAVVVLDVQDSKILAMLGNANPENPVSGFINGATIKRQPGSLLKPFLFCSAYELGILTPAAVVYDVPSMWKEYRPENIDHDYMGAIPVKDALRYSRNIPAVRVLQQIGIQRFADKLAKLDLRTVGAVGKYSLSLALGTAEMSLINLVNAYAALARGGVYMPVKVFSCNGKEQSVQVFTPQSAWLTIQSLAGSLDDALVWKTGTSWNHRDAWAICVSPDYAVGVWCGNFSGRGNDSLLGAEAALPVALEVADSIRSADRQVWVKPQGVSTRRVCALSGCVPGSYCKHVVNDWYIPGVSSQTICRLHKGKADRFNESAEIELVWPDEVAAYIKKKESQRVNLSKNSLKFISPLVGATYYLPGINKEATNLLELSAVASAQSRISYFIDGEYIGCGESGKAIEWAMIPGYHTLVASTPRENSRLNFEVKVLEEKK